MSSTQWTPVAASARDNSATCGDGNRPSSLSCLSIPVTRYICSITYYLPVYLATGYTSLYLSFLFFLRFHGCLGIVRYRTFYDGLGHVPTSMCLCISSGNPERRHIRMTGICPGGSLHRTATVQNSASRFSTPAGWGVRGVRKLLTGWREAPFFVFLIIAIIVLTVPT